MKTQWRRSTRLAAAVFLAAAATAYAADPLLPPLTIQPGNALSDQSTVRVDRFVFVGNTIFTEQQLLSAATAWESNNGKIRITRRVRDYLGQSLTLDDLEQIRVALTLYYVNGGNPDITTAGSRYVNSGAVLPDQTVGADHAVKFQVVEGKLARLIVAPLKHLRPRYVTARLNRAATPALDRDKLQNALELLRQNPNVDRINAGLSPGTATGQADLDVSIVERQPWEDGLIGAEVLKRTKKDLSPLDQFQVALQFDNHRSPSVGAERFSLLVNNDDLLGLSDSLAVRYGINERGLDDFEFAGLDDFSIDYSVPITAWDLRLEVGFLRSDSPIVEEPYTSLDINSETERYYAQLRAPLLHTPSSELAVFGGFQYQDSLTTLNGERFSLTPGAQDGESNVASVRFGVEYRTHDSEQAFSVRSAFAIGVDAFDATVASGNGADGQFVSWLSQAQYVRRLGQSGAQGIVRLNAQLTPDSLPAIEQFSLGGAATVRGYRENELVRDNAVCGTLEARYPLIPGHTDGVPLLQGAVFFDGGYAFNRDQHPAGDFIGSVGVGLITNPYRGISGEIYYGYQLNDIDDQSGNLQDNGIDFSVVVQLF